MSEEEKQNQESGSEPEKGGGQEPSSKQETAEKNDDPGRQAIEALAKDLGWNPEYKGTDRTPVDAETYIRRSKEIQDTMRNVLHEQKGEISGMRSDMKSMKGHFKKLYEAEIKSLEKQITSLQKQRKEAISEGDVDRVEDIESKIDDLKTQTKAKEFPKDEEPPRNEPNPEFQSWNAKNSWYKTDKEMTEYADIVAEKYKGAPYARILKKVEAEVRDMFPDKFENKKTKTPPANPVEGNRQTRQGTKRTLSKSDLTYEQKRTMRNFVDAGVMTEKEYLADLEKIGA